MSLLAAVRAITAGAAEAQRLAADPARLAASLPVLRQAAADAARAAERIAELVRSVQAAAPTSLSTPTPTSTPTSLSTPTSTATPTAGARGQVLVVDDDPLVGRSIARLLRASHDVTVITSPAEAVARLERGDRWDVMLCDLMMPELSGMDVEERLTTAAPEMLPRIVYLTGGAFTDKARVFLGAGRPYLEKPVEAPTLRAKVAEMLERTAAARG